MTWVSETGNLVLNKCSKTWEWSIGKNNWVRTSYYRYILINIRNSFNLVFHVTLSGNDICYSLAYIETFCMLAAGTSFKWRAILGKRSNSLTSHYFTSLLNHRIMYITLYYEIGFIHCSRPPFWMNLLAENILAKRSTQFLVFDITTHFPVSKI